jgi:hypothetical protein
VATARLIPHQKRARRRGATVVFLDETGFMLRPLTLIIWATKGETPILRPSAKHVPAFGDRRRHALAEDEADWPPLAVLRRQRPDAGVPRVPSLAASLAAHAADHPDGPAQGPSQRCEAASRGAGRWFEAEFLPA